MKILSIIVGGIIILLWAVGVAGARPGNAPPLPRSVAADVSEAINYQGRLTDSGGSPLNGTYTMRFIVYDDAVAGSALWDSGNLNVTVENGLFNVQLGVDQANFDGRALWISIIVDGETLSPRQEILPAAYALSLRPGADIMGPSLGASDAALSGFAPATGTALYADAHNGVGIFGDSEGSYGVWGSSDDSWGGYFTSENGYGIRVNTNGTDHYDHGAYITSERGYAIYAQSATNMGVRGEAGNITGIPVPLGPVGVVGLGENRGIVGSSASGMGVYAHSNSHYGIWGESSNYRGVTGRTGNADDNYGFYTPDNLYSQNYNFMGAIMQVMQNNGNAALDPGDVVIFNGVNKNVKGFNSPVVQVKKATIANSTAVAGVVFSRFNIDAVNPNLEFFDTQANKIAAMEVTSAGSASSGEYVLVVVQGMAQVKAESIDANIQPGDLLSTGSKAGLARKAETITLNNAQTAVPGAVFGKALEAFDGSQKMLYVYVTLQ